MVARILLRRAKREFVKELGREVKISKERVYFVESQEKDFHTEFGAVSAKDLKRKDGSKILSNTKKEFVILSPSFIDHYRRIERLPQIIPLKDISLIISETAIGRESFVVDAGSGSGALACFLAHIAGQVVSYDIRDDFLAVARRNKDSLKLHNLAIKKGDVYRRIDERNADLVTLDLPEPWKAVKNVAKALKIGGFLVVYNPSITQVADFVNDIVKNDKFLYMKTVEVIERSWEVEGRKVRPKSGPIGHSGFLVFVRRVR